MRVASCTYPVGWLPDWAAFAAKQREWVRDAAGLGAELAVFPEYGAMELAALGGEAAARDLRGSIDTVSDLITDAWSLFADLSTEYGIHILAPSGPVARGDKVTNTAAFLAPGGGVGYQDKQIMTRFEREEWGISGGGPLHLFDTSLGRIGILICYDSEFPLLGRALADAELLLVPSCTEATSGYWRVRIGAMARALENQCASVMSSLTGAEPRLFGVEDNTGAGGIFGPPDTGFPENGILGLGQIGTPGWTTADIDLGAIAHVRADGVVLNRTHWDDQSDRWAEPAQVRLR